jgi:predicted GNAT superfamily acetyltransferase
VIDLRADPRHWDRVLELNRAVQEMTSPLDRDGLSALLAGAALAPAVAGDGGAVDAFLIAFRPGAAYASPNYRWFCDRLPDFLYIDRVVVAGDARGKGLARALYDHVANAAGPRPLVCEVNSHPPNPGSDAFHAALGFAETGRGSPAPGKTVRYLLRQP